MWCSVTVCSREELATQMPIGGFTGDAVVAPLGQLVVLRIYVALAVFQPYRDLEAVDNESLKFEWRGGESNPGPLAPLAKSLTTRPPLPPIPPPPPLVRNFTENVFFFCHFWGCILFLGRKVEKWS